MYLNDYMFKGSNSSTFIEMEMLLTHRRTKPFIFTDKPRSLNGLIITRYH